MSRIKELKQQPENNINIIDMLMTVCPEGKTKYVETLLRLIKKSTNLDNFVIEIKKELVTRYNMKMEELDTMLPLHTIFLYRFFDSMFESEDITTFQKFCVYNERGLIANNDVSTYKDFKEIIDATALASLKVEDKEMESQIVKLYEDKEWLLLRPLTYRASRKYGANTKWCTTQENNPEYFKKYSSNGILIYCMNKVTGHKVAFFNDLTADDFGFWSQTDNKIDALMAGLPMNLLVLIQDEVKNNPATNRFLLSDEQKMKEEATIMKLTGKSKGLSDSRMDTMAGEDKMSDDEDNDMIEEMGAMRDGNDTVAMNPPSDPSPLEVVVDRRNRERAVRERVLMDDEMIEDEPMLKSAPMSSFTNERMGKWSGSPDTNAGEAVDEFMAKTPPKMLLESLKSEVAKLSEPMQSEKRLPNLPMTRGGYDAEYGGSQG